ncbi:MAG: HAD-IA family hydrolase [Clostridia bacterium]|nr:HAD-IA family hydrolase [Clostridia bacterium]
MSIKAVLFDLDGTLLPMNQDNFIKKYFGEISAFLYENSGYEPKKFVESMWKGIKAMLLNDGSKSNEKAFWEVFIKIYGEEKVKADYKVFERFYKEKFINTKTECGYTEESRKLIDYLKSKGIKVALATNPMFPTIATETRMGWVNLYPSDFELYTTYEMIGYSKPNPKYYLDIAQRIGVDPKDCLMVGNDVSDDMSANLTGMDVFLLTDCLINTKNLDIDAYAKGSFKELCEYINEKSQEN